MTDIEFIEFLARLLFDLVSDGDMPDNKDWPIIMRELRNRNLNILDEYE